MDYVQSYSVSTERFKTSYSSSGLAIKSVGSNPGYDTCVLEQDTLHKLFS